MCLINFYTDVANNSHTTRYMMLATIKAMAPIIVGRRKQHGMLSLKTIQICMIRRKTAATVEDPTSPQKFSCDIQINMLLVNISITYTRGRYPCIDDGQ